MKEQRLGLGLLLVGFVSIMSFAAIIAYDDMKKGAPAPTTIESGAQYNNKNI